MNHKREGITLMRRILVVVIAVVVACSVLVGSQAPSPGDDPIIGTWKLNVARSTSSRNPRPPAPLSDVRQFSTIEGGWNLMVRSGVDAVGHPTFGIVTFKFDGKQYPVYGQDALASFLAAGKPSKVMWSFRRIDQYTTQVTTSIDGKAIAPFVFAVSKDGTILTQAPQEAEPKDVLVFERVP